MAKSNVERQRGFADRQRDLGRVPVKFWVGQEPAKGYKTVTEVASRDEVGELLYAIASHPNGRQEFERLMEKYCPNSNQDQV